MGETTKAVNLVKLCQAIGVEHVVEVNAFDTASLTRVIKEETARDEVSVIITKSPCVLLKGNVFPEFCVPDSAQCKKCGMCLRPGCPALTKKEDGTIAIDATMCNGCGLCMQLCKFDAIKKQAR